MLPIVALAGAIGACCGILVIWRAAREQQACVDWFKVVRYLLRVRSPAKTRYLTHALLKECCDNPTDFVEMRVLCLFGPRVVFPRSPGLIKHITSSNKYQRVNPLNGSKFGMMADALMLATGMKTFLDRFFARSIWFQPSGEVHDRQRTLFMSFVPKFLKQPVQEEIYNRAVEVLEERATLRPAGKAFDLFDLLQEVVAVLQLEFINDYKLSGSAWTVEQYLALTNGAFGSLYAFSTPDQPRRLELMALCRDLLQRAGPNGLAAYIRKNVPQDLPEHEREEELVHNVMAGLLLGQQALANAAFWVIRRLVLDEQLRKRFEANEALLPPIVLEEIRLHPPSSPFLMPYVAQEHDAYGGLDLPRGSIVVVMPILLHLNEKLWSHASEFHQSRFGEAAAALPAGGKGAVPLASVKATMQCPHSGALASPGAQWSQCPFGVGQATCPMKGFSMSVLCNLVTAVFRDWAVTIHGDDLSSEPVARHVLIDMGSRPLRPIRASFERKR